MEFFSQILSENKKCPLKDKEFDEDSVRLPLKMTSFLKKRNLNLLLFFYLYFFFNWEGKIIRLFRYIIITAFELEILYLSKQFSVLFLDIYEHCLNRL